MFSNHYNLCWENAEVLSTILPLSLTAFSPTLLETVLAIGSALLVADPSKVFTAHSFLHTKYPSSHPSTNRPP